MIQTTSSPKRFTTKIWSPAVAGLLALALASCGGTHTKHNPPHRQTSVTPPPPGRSTTTTQPPRILQASAIPMMPTPRAALTRCRQSTLLRLVCPREVPQSLHPVKYDLADGCANAPHITIASVGCSLPVWSYETFSPLPGQTAGAQLSAWDGNGWFAPSYAPMYPPPYHVHIDIEAAAGTPPPSIQGPSFAGAEAVNRITDALLNPNRRRAVRLGQVRWYRRQGQLVLAPTGPAGGGEEAGHLIFYFTANGVNYDVSLHAWASKIRITDHGATRLVKAPGQGPALPHVIATLNAIVGSALSG